MRVWLILFITTLPLLAQWQFQGYVGTEVKLNSTNKPHKESSSKALAAQLQGEYALDTVTFKGTLEALYDSHDPERRYLQLNEAYLRYQGENTEWSLGRQIRFWGALEAFNLVNILSRQRIVRDPFDKAYRNGAWMGTVTHYFEDESALELIVKAYEENEPFESPSSLYTVFPLPYDATLLTEERRATPTFYLRYFGTTDSDMPLDYSFGIARGYDAQRTFRVAKGALQQYAYLSRQLFMHHTLLLENTLYKLEALYSDVEENSLSGVGDSLHYGAGVEHTFEQLYNGMDAGVLAEYYRYRQLNYPQFQTIRPYIFMDNDLFVGTRITFNDAASSELVGGGIWDCEGSGETQYYLQFKRRFLSSLLLDADARYVKPSDSKATFFQESGEHARISINLKYYF